MSNEEKKTLPIQVKVSPEEAKSFFHSRCCYIR